MNAQTENSEILSASMEIKVMLLSLQKQIEAITHEAENRLLKDLTKEQDIRLESPRYGHELIDTRVLSKTTVLSPKLLASLLPVSKRSAQTTKEARENIAAILNHKDNRIILIVGPCAIHDPKAAIEYADHVKQWREKYGSNIEIIMRTYIEKPRTELGWKGFIYDPLLNGSNDINLGLVASRMLARRITDLGVPIAVERLNALTPQYLNSLVAYDVIGARNTTDQKAREYASATSSPVGFKNTPEGSIEFAAQAIVSAGGEHAFLGIDSYGATKQINSAGNNTGHIILRGASNGPNYSPLHIAQTKQILANKNLRQSIIIDVSHGNSGKKASQQIIGIRNICQQLAGNEQAIRGAMIESNLVHGNQKLEDPAELQYGLSIVDECVDIAETEEMLDLLAEAAAKRQNISSLSAESTKKNETILQSK